ARQELLSNRLVVAALVFVLAMWIAAFASPEFRLNAIKAAVRYSAGFALLCVALRAKSVKQMQKFWTAAAVAAAIYALIDYFGFGFPKLFRDVEFWFEDMRRLSGSLEYPNVAAAYYAMSLPIVWTTIEKRRTRILASI